MKRLKLLMLLFLFSCMKENSIKESWAGYLVDMINSAECISPKRGMDTIQVTYTQAQHDDPTNTVALIPMTKGHHFFFYKYRVQ